MTWFAIFALKTDVIVYLLPETMQSSIFQNIRLFNEFTNEFFSIEMNYLISYKQLNNGNFKTVMKT